MSSCQTLSSSAAFHFTVYYWVARASLWVRPQYTGGLHDCCPQELKISFRKEEFISSFLLTGAFIYEYLCGCCFEGSALGH